MILFGENINLVKINTTEALSGAGMVVRARGSKHILVQGWANYGPRAKYGPLRGSMRPAEGLENAKKNRFQKTFVRT
jgi:hypothetical protein